MTGVKVTLATPGKEKRMKRKDMEKSLNRGWQIEDEENFIRYIGEYTNPEIRRPWGVSRLRWLVRYLNCLTLRENFGTIDKQKLIDRVHKEIMVEASTIPGADKSIIDEMIDRDIRMMNEGKYADI